MIQFEGRRGLFGAICGVLAIVTFALALLQPVSYADADAAMMLVAAQSLLEDGEADLDSQADDPRFSYQLDRTYNKRIRSTSDGWRYVSIGSPIVVAPAVFVANRLGFDMVDRQDELALQELLSALSCATILLLLIAVCRTRLAPGPALVVATAGFFGTSLVSTLATGLWGHHFVVITACVTMLVLDGMKDQVNGPRTVGILSLIAVTALCRPAGILLAALPVGFVAIRLLDRKRLNGLVLVSALCFLTTDLWAPLFAWLPEYYGPRRLSPLPSAEGLLGLTISPSRGLLVLSPLVLWTLLLLPRALRLETQAALLRATLAWVLLWFWLVAGHEMWWGGHSYGTRHMVDAMPGIVYLSAAAWQAMPAARLRRFGIAFLVATMLGVVVHTGVGLFNPRTRTWNHRPDVDRYHDLLFSWRYPQLLATGQTLDSRFREKFDQPLDRYRFGETVALDGANAVFVGWHENEAEWRWSEDENASVLLDLPELEAAALYELELTATSLEARTVSVRVNDRDVGSFVAPIDELVLRTLVVDGSQLKPGERNEIEFRTDGVSSSPGDPRRLGIALFDLRLGPAP